MRPMPVRLPALIPSPEAVRKFKEIYDAKFGGDLDAVKALELATYCLRLAYMGTRRLPTSIEIISPRRKEPGSR